MLQGANGVAEILGQAHHRRSPRVGPDGPAGGPAAIGLDRRQVAEGLDRRGPRGLGAVPGLDQLARAHVQVKFDLAADVPGDVRYRARQSEESAHDRGSGRCRVERRGDRSGVRLPASDLRAELAPAGYAELVVLGLPPRLGQPPLLLEPPLSLEAVERGIEGALLDGEGVLGGLPDPPADAVAVHGPPAQGLEDEDVEGADEEVAARHGCLPVAIPK